MMEVVLIRHGKTPGNALRRYIGTTNEPLSADGRAWFAGKKYPDTELLFVSPLKRCRETAALIYPDREQTVIADLAECDFGAFENKNADELSGDPRYQEWIDSMGTLPFPGGETVDGFKARCVRGFRTVLEIMKEKNVSAASVVAHGGTIMSIMEAFAYPGRSYYDWMMKNGQGFRIRIEEVCSDEMEMYGSRNDSGLCAGSDPRGSEMDVPSGAADRKADRSDGTNYEVLVP